MTYPLGSKVTVRARFKNASGAPAEPTETFLLIKRPDKREVPLQYGDPGVDIVHEGVGVYSYEILGDMPDRWVYRWVGTGDVATSGEKFFNVGSSEFTNPLPT